MLKVKTRHGKAYVARIDVAGTFEFGSVPIPRRDSPTRFFFSFLSSNFRLLPRQRRQSLPLPDLTIPPGRFCCLPSRPRCGLRLVLQSPAASWLLCLRMVPNIAVGLWRARPWIWVTEVGPQPRKSLLLSFCILFSLSLVSLSVSIVAQ